MTFSVPLDACATSSRTVLVPLIVEVCAQIVETLGLSSQGIYRVPGHSASVTELLEEVNTRADPTIISTAGERWGDVNVVASLLKLFFRKLPEALITDVLYESVISAVRCQHAEKSALKLKRLLRELPDQNRATLRHVVLHLARVARHRQAANKMERSQSGDDVRPVVSSDPMRSRWRIWCVTSMIRGNVVERLILHHDWYFGDWTADVAIPPEGKTAELASSSSNLQLLASAESLVAAMQRVNDAAAAATAAQADEPTGGFFSLGSGRLSRKNRSKSTRDGGKDEGAAMELNREVELRRVKIPGGAAPPLRRNPPRFNPG